MQRVEKWLRHCSISLFISLFVTEAAVRSSFSGTDSAVSIHSHKRKRSLESRVRDSGSHIDSGKRKGKWKTTPAPTSSPPSCQISIWSVSWGIGEAALYRRIRAWLAQISRIQWGMEERVLFPLTADTVHTLLLFNGQRNGRRKTARRWMATVTQIWHCCSLDDFQNYPPVWIYASVTGAEHFNINLCCYQIKWCLLIIPYQVFGHHFPCLYVVLCYVLSVCFFVIFCFFYKMALCKTTIKRFKKTWLMRMMVK